MKMSESIDKIAPAILAAQEEMGNAEESGVNNFDRYKYAKLRDYYKACRKQFHKHGVFVCETILETVQIENRLTKKNENRYATRVKIELMMVHKSGQWMSVVSDGEGQDVGDKGTYKAITGARKYGIAMAANLSTGDDPEKPDENDAKESDKDGRPRASSRTTPPTPSTPTQKVQQEVIM